MEGQALNSTLLEGAVLLTSLFSSDFLFDFVGLFGW